MAREMEKGVAASETARQHLRNLDRVSPCGLAAELPETHPLV